MITLVNSSYDDDDDDDDGDGDDDDDGGGCSGGGGGDDDDAIKREPNMHTYLDARRILFAIYQNLVQFWSIE